MTFDVIPYLSFLPVGIAVIVLGARSRSANRVVVAGSGVALLVFVAAQFLWNTFGISVVVASPFDVWLGAQVALNVLLAVPVALLAWAALKPGRSTPPATHPTPTWPRGGPGDGAPDGRW
ncbi:hypothetical protein J4H86_26270 [Spiractinospora alimapuensis]|uniref:hypothetical protein n=1 Tax=Spiractinospora alimapuensis TaxID=2820884 RepID=UPI001F25926F|nr:hypothetical protein [Spiractinospora alimapuensis]QVQ52163.1 hypothetical protein J4H86_26270 [Spiractinospora alimapuensis]